MDDGTKATYAYYAEYITSATAEWGGQVLHANAVAKVTKAAELTQKIKILTLGKALKLPNLAPVIMPPAWASTIAALGPYLFPALCGVSAGIIIYHLGKWWRNRSD
jgi:hypothetical protein